MIPPDGAVGGGPTVPAEAMAGAASRFLTHQIAHPLVIIAGPSRSCDGHNCKRGRGVAAGALGAPACPHPDTASALDKGQQICVEPIVVRLSEAVRSALVDLQLHLQRRIRDDFGRKRRGSVDRHNLVVTTMNDQHWNVHVLQVLRLVHLRESTHAIELALQPTRHTWQPERLANAVGHRSHVPVVALERNSEVLVERPVERALRIPSNTDIGNTARFASVFSINGGTAPINTSFDTRFEPRQPI